MSNVIPFVPKSGLAASAALNEYIQWAKSQGSLYDGPDEPFQWMAFSWDRWDLKKTACSKLGKRSEMLSPDFVDYAKATLFEERVVALRVSSHRLMALRCLEVAMLEIIQKGDVTSVSAAVFDKACDIAKDHYSSAVTAYIISGQLKYICNHLHSAGIVAKPFIWEPQIKPPRKTLKSSAEAAATRLPSDTVLMALGEIFYSKPELPLDVLVTSAVAIMLSQPSRISELSYLKKDCLFIERDAQGREQLYILWYSAKNFGANRKLVPDSMSKTCKEAVKRVVEITQKTREYARWLEENPESFPYHSDVPNKGLDTPLSVQEACDALMCSTKNRSPRAAFRLLLAGVVKNAKYSVQVHKIAQELLDGYDTSKGKRHYVNGRLAKLEFHDTWEITLRKLNKMVRGIYLPRYFPYTDSRRITKFQDALFCFRTGTLTAGTDVVQVKPFGLVGSLVNVISQRLTGSIKNVKTIFERHGYKGMKVNSHAFRHFLNTASNRAGLSPELIARWSGRVDVSQNRVYNHMSPEEKVEEIESFTSPLVASSRKLLASLKTNAPITMKDLGRESDRIVHRTEYGICIHDYAQEPCAKFNNCLTCGEHVCVKGDKTKLANLKDEREYLRRSLVNFHREADKGTYGANTWLNTALEKMERCDQLIQVLENPDIEDGAVIRGLENGWTAGRNALALRGDEVEEDAALIETDGIDDKVKELEKLLGIEGKHGKTF